VNGSFNTQAYLNIAHGQGFTCFYRFVNLALDREPCSNKCFMDIDTSIAQAALSVGPRASGVPTGLVSLTCRCLCAA
jgi:hypothetical protein